MYVYSIYAKFDKSTLSKGKTMTFLCRSSLFGNSSAMNLLDKGNCVPFLSQIGWFGHKYAECSEQRE